MLLLSAGCRASFHDDADSSGSTEASADSTTDDSGGEATNLLQNGDFELWSGDAPAGWVVGGDAVVSATDQDPHGGEMALSASLGPAYSSITQSVPLAVPIEAGDFIEISGWTRLSGGTGSIGVDAYVQNVDDGSDWTLGFGDFVSTNGSWGQAQRGVVADGRITHLRLDIAYEGSGLQVDLDDFTLTVTPP